MGTFQRPLNQRFFKLSVYEWFQIFENLCQQQQQQQQEEQEQEQKEEQYQDQQEQEQQEQQQLSDPNHKHRNRGHVLTNHCLRCLLQ